MKIVLIIVVVALCIIALYAIPSLQKRRRKMSRQSGTAEKPSERVSVDRKAQNAKNLRVISKLILGNYLYVTRKSKRKSVRAFDRWQEKENVLWDTASADQKKLLAEYVKGSKDPYSFLPVVQNENPCKESKGYPPGYELFLKNAFTDPFPSLHDMCEWAVSNKLAELFVAYKISPEESKQYLFHLKRYYVNHKMANAIIQFDLWKIPKIT